MNLTFRIVVDILVFFLGLFIGNRLNIGRDKRKEFNDLSMQLFIDINKHIALGENGLHANTGGWRLIEPYIPIYKRHSFRRAVNRYEEAQQNIATYNTATGIATFNKNKVEYHIICAKKLLSYLKRR